REDIINEHSFGYQIVNSHMDRDIQVVEEVKMFEVSSVVWGANENTPTISVNSLEMNDLYSKLDNLLKTNELLENKLNELLALVPALQHNDPKEDLLLDLNYITDYIKNYKK
ncbi:MAG: HK97 family phage prohead protease, partial [Candidatus Riesia sp.]|nr:HK97 family phage prohead protease [Candidatus Riesia sp.]